jgi:hypothetical protein
MRRGELAFARESESGAEAEAESWGKDSPIGPSPRRETETGMREPT